MNDTSFTCAKFVVYSPWRRHVPKRVREFLDFLDDFKISDNKGFLMYKSVMVILNFFVLR